MHPKQKEFMEDTRPRVFYGFGYRSIMGIKKMANITRCDECKKLSDETGPLEYIGKDWVLKKYKEVIAHIKTNKDLCEKCTRELMSKLNLSKDEMEDF